ncbi:MAG TPA: hypothetical protein PKA88_00435 [Polyangiaceae bacterium]|nr:hypothetical protein [Polyangiaceae bacterium]HMR80125.1 hypothetical protein [Polyangiaceae bacterium]
MALLSVWPSATNPEAKGMSMCSSSLMKPHPDESSSGTALLVSVPRTWIVLGLLRASGAKQPPVPCLN